MSEFAALAEKLGGDVVTEVKGSLAADYEALTDEQKASIKTAGVKVMDLRLRLQVASDPIEIADLQAKLQAVESAVQDWKVWGEIGADVAFWKGVQVVAATLGSFLGGRVGEAANRLIPGL